MRRHWYPSIVKARRIARETIAANSAPAAQQPLFRPQQEDPMVFLKANIEIEVSEATWLFDENLGHYVLKKMRYIDGRRAQTQVLE